MAADIVNVYLIGADLTSLCAYLVLLDVDVRVEFNWPVSYELLEWGSMKFSFPVSSNCAVKETSGSCLATVSSPATLHNCLCRYWTVCSLLAYFWYLMSETRGKKCLLQNYPINQGSLTYD